MDFTPIFKALYFIQLLNQFYFRHPIAWCTDFHVFKFKEERIISYLLFTMVVKAFYITATILAFFSGFNCISHPILVSLLIYLVQGAVVGISVILDIILCSFGKDIVLAANWVISKEQWIILHGM